MTRSAKDALAQLQRLQEQNEQRIEKQSTRKPTLAFMKDVRNGSLYRYDFEDLFSDVPFGVALLAVLCAASTSPLANEVSLKDCEPAGGNFKTMSQPGQLKAVLVQIVQNGSTFLQSSNRDLDETSMHVRSMPERFSAITRCLSELDRRTGDFARMQLHGLKDMSKDCTVRAENADKRLNEWLELINEVSKAVSAKKANVKVDGKSNTISLAGAEVDALMTEKSAQDSTKHAQTVMASLQSSDKLSDVLAGSSIGENITLQMLSSNSQSDAVAFAQGLSKVLGAKAVQQTNAKPISGVNGATPDSRSAVLGRADTALSHANDPAYGAALQLAAPASTLNVLVTADAAAATPKDTLVALEAIVKCVIETTPWTSAIPSNTCKAAALSLQQVIAEAQKSGNKPNAAATSAAVSVIATLTSTASSLPGLPSSGAPTLGGSDEPKGSDQVELNAALQCVQSKVKIVEASYSSTRSRYDKLLAQRSALREQTSKIQNDLLGRDWSKASLDDVQKALTHLLGTMIQLKSQTSSLVAFFTAHVALIDQVLIPRLESVHDIARLSPDKSARKLQFLQEQLFTAVLMFQSWHMLVKSSLDSYKETFDRGCRPALQMLDQLQHGDTEMAKHLLPQFKRLTEDGQRDWQRRTQRAQEEVRDQMSKAQELVSEIVRGMPALPPAVDEAIRNGAQSVTDEVIKGLDLKVDPVLAGA